MNSTKGCFDDMDISKVAQRGYKFLRSENERKDVAKILYIYKSKLTSQVLETNTTEKITLSLFILSKPVI